MPEYKISCPISSRQVAELRESVGWNGLMFEGKRMLQNAHLYICCFEDHKLIGFLAVVSNDVTDAYIQDVVVRPEFQRRGIGTRMMKMALEELENQDIYTISVVFRPELQPFYDHFGFTKLSAGRLETRQTAE